MKALSEGQSSLWGGFPVSGTMEKLCNYVMLGDKDQINFGEIHAFQRYHIPENIFSSYL